MNHLKFKRPSANSLVVFDVASRHLKFSAAAAELRTTPVAVSSQIKLLEDHLGTRLFDRVHRGLRLTQAGETLAESVARSFKDISITLERVAAKTNVNHLAVSVSQGMSSHWLMPRISNFRHLHPEADIRFHVTDAYVDLKAEDVDIALRYGDGPWKDVKAKRLMRVRRFPVCSPKYLENAAALDSLDDLSQHELLYLSGRYGKMTRWDDWLRALGFDRAKAQHALTFDDHNSLTEAVLAGQGIALGGPPHLSHYLQGGQLIRPFDNIETQHRFFWIVEQNDAPKNPLKSAFASWLEEEMNGSIDPGED